MDTFTVRRVISGDTFVIKDKTIGKAKVQIAGITSAISANGNCDERFRDILTGLLPKGSDVELNLKDLDDQGNATSDVIFQGDIAKKLIKRGYAQVNLARLEDISPSRLKKLERLQQRAIDKKKGFWSDAFADCRPEDFPDDVISSEAEITSTSQLPEFTTKPDSGIPGYNGASDIQCSTCSWTDIGFVPGQSTQLFGDQDITVATLFDPELVGPDMAEPITG
ncbi:MAG: thermonuclease family protein [Synechococcus sp. BS301-5m-G54]|nr:thermonuclease family protein [Synechococcus sp. BS301-5m-G54]MBL6796732.1 thermonuclease family protein [Synechococcus sp. BS307-5m-G34]